MILCRDIELSQGIFLENISEISQNADIFKIRYEEKNLYGLVEKIKPSIELGLMAKEIYKILKTNTPLELTEARGFTDFSDYKIFLYGEKNEFINSIITNTTIDTETGELETYQRLLFNDLEIVKFDLENRIINKTPSFSIGDIIVTKVMPTISLLLETNEEFDIEISDIDCSQTEGILEFKEGMLEVVDPSMILEQFPVDVHVQKTVPITISYTVDEIDKTFETDAYINICNKKQMRSNFEGAVLDSECLFEAVADVDSKTTFVSEDIGFLANAIFEIDEKLTLIQEQLDLPNTVSFSESLGENNIVNGKGVNFMAEMWARWIQTGRRTFDQCPKQYQDEVKALLADIGLDENGQPLKSNTKTK